MSDIPDWLRGVRPQLSRMTRQPATEWGPPRPEYWSLTVYSLAGSHWELRVFVNMDSDLRGAPVDRYTFHHALDDGASDWQEVVTHQSAREQESELACYACDEICDAQHQGKECPRVEEAVKKYVETHHMVYPDAACWEIKQHLLRHWHALTLLVAVGP